MTRLPRSPSSTLVLRLNQETVHDFVPLFLPPCGPNLTPLATGSLEPSLLVFSTPGGLTGTTFHASSSPAPTPVKPQPAPAILSQESVHTTLSITHHTRKRPSTGPRTTHGPQTCLASTQVLRSRRVSSASKSLDCVVAHRSDRCSSPVRPVPTGQTGQTHRLDRSGAAAPPSSVLQSWLCGSAKEPSGFLVNHRKPRELGVASANRHS
jgi:hypothetical protein